MSPWPFVLDLQRSSDRPLFIQVARAIADEIRRGRLRRGERLPGSRTLAKTLSVHRVTIVAAYEALESEGWITPSRARGTFVSSELPDVAPQKFSRAAESRRAVPSKFVVDLPEAPFIEDSPEPGPGRLVLSGSTPDLRLIPIDVLARAYRRALRSESRASLGYGSSAGHPRLRAALAAMLSATRGLAADVESLVVTRGSQMALALVARALLRPGDVVAVEQIGYRRAWETFRLAGARLVSVPVDAQGLRVDLLERLLKTERVRAVYVTPHHQFPTTVSLAPGRRMQLLELARATPFVIIEDDYDHEFHYDGRPILPLASADSAGSVAYIGTLSKVLAPGLRMGYLVAPAPLLAAVVAHRGFVDMQGDHAIERAVAELLEEGDVQRHVRRVRRMYQARRDRLASLLREHLAGVVDFVLPTGGLAIWVRINRQVDVERWALNSEARGVAFQTARWFTFDRKPRPFARLGYGPLDERELTRAVQTLRDALPRSARSAATTRS